MGFITVLAQITFLRRGIANFSGNELGLAVALFSWLAWVSAGGLLARKIFPKLHRPERALYAALLLLAVLFPATTAFLDLLRPFLGVPVGQVVGLGFMGLVYAVLLAPFCLVDGADFTFGAAAAGTGRTALAFAAESAGAAAGGVFFFVAGVRYFDGLGLAWAVGIVVAVLVAFLGWGDRIVRWVAIALILIFLLPLFQAGMPSDSLTRPARFHPYFPVIGLQSPLGSLTWAKPLNIREEGGSAFAKAMADKGRREEGRFGKGDNAHDQDNLFLDQSVLFYDGSPLMTDPDPRAAEQAVHPALILHPKPKEVLLVTSYVTGVLEQVLNHPVRSVDVVVLDEAVARLEALNTRSAARALSDERVTLIPGDARRYLRMISDGQYDVVILNLPDPGTLLYNRYYSAQFFQLVSTSLAPGGVFGLAVGEPGNYIPAAMGQYLASLDGALSYSFSNRTWYPLDRYVALCSEESLPQLTGEVAAYVALERRLDLRFMIPEYLDADLSKDRMAAVKKAISSAGNVRPNLDLVPSAVGHRLTLWRGRTADAGLLSGIGNSLGWYFFVAVLVMVVFVAFGAGSWKKGGLAVKGGLILFLGGFSGIAAETLLMYLYQSGFGYLYSRMALLLAFFMVGMALGAVIKWGHPFRTAWLWAGYFLSLTFVVAFMVRTSMGRALPEWAGLLAYLLLITGAGLLTGVSFKAGSSLLEEAGIRHPGGMAYGVDIFGAALGTVVCGLVLPLAIGLFAPIRYCLLLSVAIAAGISIGSAKD
jgi:spermidine synthase